MDKIGGYFTEIGFEPIKNTLVSEGGLRFARSMFRAEAVLPTNFFIGLTNSSYDFDSVLTDLEVGEPSGNGYARQQCTRNTSDWTVQEVNGIIQIKSKTCVFTASADWDKTWQRMFLASVASGAGQLYAVSGPAPAPRTVLNGAAPSISYEFWLRG